jgi:hypothetical protein
MHPFVCGRADRFQVLAAVVELVSVAMMDAVTGWNGSVERLPHQHMLHAEPSLSGIVDSPVTLWSDLPVTARSRGARTAFAHDGSAYTTSGVLSNIAWRSLLLAFAV